MEDIMNKKVQQQPDATTRHKKPQPQSDATGGDITPAGYTVLMQLLSLPQQDAESLLRLVLSAETQHFARNAVSADNTPQLASASSAGRNAYTAYCGVEREDQEHIFRALMKRHTKEALEELRQAKACADAAAQRLTAQHPERDTSVRYKRKRYDS